MDEEGIGLVLARASELRSKITNCIHKASTLQTEHTASKQDQQTEPPQEQEQEQEEEEAAAAESLLNIRDALESLEAQLSSLQALQQQQWYDKEAALAEIDYSRKKLLKKLKEYKGEELEVIGEATAFASKTVEDDNDLLLPPYPTRPPHFPSTRKFAQNGMTSDDLKKSLHESERDQVTSESNSSFRGVRRFINGATKTILTLAGVICVLSLAGFETKFRKRDTQLKVLGIFEKPGAEEERGMLQCPPGKVLVIEDGETRCLVKERVEIPFESVVATPDVNYGCG